MRDVTIGIDPGRFGCIAILDPEVGLILHDMPMAGKEYDPAAFVQLMRPYAGRARAAVEAQFGHQHESGKAARTAGFGMGMLQTGLLALDIAVEVVQPAVWVRQAPGGNLTGTEKMGHMLRARQLWPEHAAKFTGAESGKASGRADAALIAEWRRRQG
jgi:hypothetical protein